MSGLTVAQELPGDDTAESAAADLTATAARYLAAALPDPHATAADPASAYRRLRSGLADLGWFELPADRVFGGTGAPKLTTPLFGVAGRALVPGPLLEEVVLAPALAATMPDRQAELAERTPFAFIDLVAAGQEPVTATSGETGPGRASPGGSGLTLDDGMLTGSAGPVPHAGNVSWLLAAATSLAGPCLMLLPAGHPGVRIVPVATMDPCSTSGYVSFATPVGAAETLATGDAAAALLVSLRSLARLALSAESHGIAAQLTDLSVSYALQREQFGRLTGSFQAVKHVLAGMTRDVLSLGNLVAAVTSRLPADPPSTALWCAIAKAHASQVALTAAASALQVHGGIGFTEEHSLQLYYKRALSLESRFGQPADLNALIGTARITGQPLIR